MIKLTQERIENLLEFNSGEVDGSAANAEAWEVHELARIALASLEAEPGEYLTHVVDDGCGEFSDRMNFSLPIGTKLYSAPPAPESVPDGVLKSLLPDAEKSEFWFEHDGKILFEGVKFNNAVFDACRAAMLQEAK